MADRIYPVRLKEGEDQELIDWLDSLPKGTKSYWIKMTMRKGKAVVENLLLEIVNHEVKTKRPDAGKEK